MKLYITVLPVPGIDSKSQPDFHIRWKRVTTIFSSFIPIYAMSPKNPWIPRVSPSVSPTIPTILSTHRSLPLSASGRTKRMLSQKERVQSDSLAGKRALCCKEKNAIKHCVSMSAFWAKLLGHASIYGSDANYPSGPSNQINVNLGPSKAGGLGPLLSSKSLAFATLRMSSGRDRPTSTVYVLGLTVNCLQCSMVELWRV